MNVKLKPVWLGIVIWFLLFAAGGASRADSKAVSLSDATQTSIEFSRQADPVNRRLINEKLGDEEYAKLRREATTLNLKALKVLLDNNAPDVDFEPDYPPIVPIPNWNPPSGPRYEAALKRYDEYREAMMDMRHQESARGWRRVLEANIAAMCIQRRPYDLEELRTLASQVLQDIALANRLVDRANQMLTDRAEYAVWSGRMPPRSSDFWNCVKDAPEAPLPTGPPADAGANIPLARLKDVSAEIYRQGWPLRRKALLIDPCDEQGFARARREFIVYSLMALKVFLANGVSDEDSQPIIPELTDTSVTPEARKEALLPHGAWRLRKCYADQIVSSYTMAPSDSEELRRLASEILGNPTVASKLADAVREMMLTQSK